MSSCLAIVDRKEKDMAKVMNGGSIHNGTSGPNGSTLNATAKPARTVPKHIGA
jgi:hypothetical protein